MAGYRLTLLSRNSDTQQDHLNDDKIYIAPALTWRPDEDTSLTLLSFYQKTDTRFPAPLPYQLVKGVGVPVFHRGAPRECLASETYPDSTCEPPARYRSRRGLEPSCEWHDG
ncbi:hypothetical protein AOA61_26720 [Pseudomonas sp. 2995-1]|nr:hypothetical protein AOA61_26720 [Pseudomonas sp. 2995-1]